jgi:HrpA-like RNA helicase
MKRKLDVPNKEQIKKSKSDHKELKTNEIKKENVIENDKNDFKKNDKKVIIENIKIIDNKKEVNKKEIIIKDFNKEESKKILEKLDEEEKKEMKEDKKEEEKIKEEINLLTGNKFSKKYYDILNVRKGLPVYNANKDFLKLVADNNIIILVGETGSGKTTQVRFHF